VGTRAVQQVKAIVNKEICGVWRTGKKSRVAERLGTNSKAEGQKKVGFIDFQWSTDGGREHKEDRYATPKDHVRIEAASRREGIQKDEDARELGVGAIVSSYRWRGQSGTSHEEA